MKEHSERAMARMQQLEDATLEPQEILDLGLPEQVAKLVDWIPMRKYLNLYEETEAAVMKRIATKVWKEGVQWSRPAGAGRWISIKGVNAWAAVHVKDRS